MSDQNNRYYQSRDSSSGSSKKKKENEKDPVGRSVFYPRSLPPPPRKSSLPSLLHRSRGPSGGSRSPQPTISTHQLPEPLPSFAHSPPGFSSHRQSGTPSTFHALGLGVEGQSPMSYTPQIEDRNEFPFPSITILRDPASSPNFRSPDSSSSMQSEVAFTSTFDSRLSGSPPLELATILEQWEAFTPDRSTSSRRGEETDPSIASPQELPLNELIDDAMIADDDGPTAIPPPVLNVKLGQRRDSPALYNAGRFAQFGSGSYSPYQFGSPVQPSPPGPVPSRQMPWGPSFTSFTGRRASAPISISGASPPVSKHTPRVVPPQLAPSAVSPHHSFLSATQLRRAPPDLFSANYSLNGTVSPLVVDLGGEQNTRRPSVLDIPIHFLEPTIGSDGSTSQVAAGHLVGKILNTDFTKKYQVGDELGSGGFGFVCSAIQTGYGNEAGKEVAVKFILKDKITDSEQAFVNGIPVEAYILGRVSHPNIIRSYELFEDKEFWYLVQELHGDPWVEGPTLQPLAQVGVAHHPPSVPSKPTQLLSSSPITSHPIGNLTTTTPSNRGPFTSSPLSRQASITGWTPPSTGRPEATLTLRPIMGRRASHDLFEAVENQRFTEDQARCIFRQIVDAVAYLHQQGIYHRDLKDENIVIDRNLTVKVIDFGSAVVEDVGNPQVYDQFRGTMTYAAAEILTGRMYEAAPADVWSLGILLAIILTGESPFPNVAYAQTGQMRWKKWVSPGALDLITKCLVPDPRRRWSPQEMLGHPWLRNQMRASMS